MEKAGVKTRDIQFFSHKNNQMVCVHSRWARDYAKYLEEQAWVERYEAGVPLELERFSHVNPVGIRAGYFEQQWESDFLLHYPDGRCGIRELAVAEDLSKQAALERLEFSRRYWSILDITDWKIVLIGGNT